MSNQTAYIQISSSDIGIVKPQGQPVNFHQPQVEPWRERLEREMLENARRDATRGERSALEPELWRQVSGEKPAEKVSPAFASERRARFQATRPQPSRKEVELESRLFEQVAAIAQNGDSSHFPGKPGL